MSERDLIRDFQTKCAVGDVDNRAETAGTGAGHANHRYCSLYETRALKSCYYPTLSHPRTHFSDELAFKSSSSKPSSSSPREILIRRDAKPSVPRELLLRGSMALRANGQVSGEMRGKVFSRGEEELVKGENGFVTISDDGDTDDEDSLDFRGQCSDALRVGPSSTHALKLHTAESCHVHHPPEEAVPKPRKYLLDARTYASKKGGGGGASAAQVKTIAKGRDDHLGAAQSSTSSSPTGWSGLKAALKSTAPPAHKSHRHRQHNQKLSFEDSSDAEFSYKEKLLKPPHRPL